MLGATEAKPRRLYTWLNAAMQFHLAQKHRLLLKFFNPEKGQQKK